VDLTKLEAQIAQANSLISLIQSGPLIGGVTLLIKMVAKLFEHHGVSIAPFATEIARFTAATDETQAAIDAYRAKFPAGAAHD
jgi:hypothetical protein